MSHTLSSCSRRTFLCFCTFFAPFRFLRSTGPFPHLSISPLLGVVCGLIEERGMGLPDFPPQHSGTRSEMSSVFGSSVRMRSAEKPQDSECVDRSFYVEFGGIACVSVYKHKRFSLLLSFALRTRRVCYQAFDEEALFFPLCWVLGILGDIEASNFCFTWVLAS